VVITVALGQPDDGRLRHELMQRLGIATDVDSRMAATRIGGRIWFGATAPRGGDVDRLLQGMEDVLHALRRDGLTQQEIDNAVGLLRAQELRPAGDSLGLARQLALFEVYVHDATFLPRELELLQAVTPAEVLAFVRKHMTDANRIDFFGNPAPEPTKPE
jgi:predicted Zn-dependent peptidase